MRSWWLAAILPIIGALIGWLTNWLAVKMIFRPRRPVRIAGVRIEGLLPRRRGELALNVARTVERDLLSVHQIQMLIKEMVEGDKVRTLLHARVDALIAEQLEKLGPMVRMFVSGDFAAKIKHKIEEEVVRFVESLSGELHDEIAEHLDIQEMVRLRIESFDLDRLEEIVSRIASRELRHIEILGGVLGFLVGVVESAIVLAT